MLPQLLPESGSMTALFVRFVSTMMIVAAMVLVELFGAIFAFKFMALTRHPGNGGYDHE